MAAKNSQDSTELKPLSTIRSLVEFIENDAFMMFPQKDDWRKRFILTMHVWADRKDSVDITDLPLELNMYRSTYYNWVKIYPDVKAAHEHIKLKIATRRRKGALFRKMDKEVAFKDMHIYDPEWKEVDAYHADLKKQDDSKVSHTFHVYPGKPPVLTADEIKEQREEKT